MAKDDEDKTTFHAKRGTFCYTRMSFDLRNVGETYQRLVDHVFKYQIGRNVESYIDDMVIKSRDETTFISDIKETLARCKEVGMKLYHKKCLFGVEEGRYFGLCGHSGRNRSKSR